MLLYEHSHWTDFIWDDAVIAPLLSDVRFAQGKLLGRVADLGFTVDTPLEVDALSSEIVASSRIEGVTLEAKAVRSSVARQLGLDDFDRTVSTHTVDGAVSVMLDATQNFAEPLTSDRLSAWHAALFPTGYSGLHKITVAHWRTAPMDIVSGPIGHEKIHYAAPDAARVPHLMDELIDWFNESSTAPLAKAAIAHLWFLTVHPFDDGNGRIARVLTEMLLARSDNSPRRFYSMASYILNHRENYYAALEKAQHGTSDITEWLRWFLEALLHSLQSGESAVNEALARSAWWHAIEGVSLNERQRLVLQKLLGSFEGKLTTRKWAKLCKVSPDTALRDINDLIAKGLLVRDDAAGGRSTSYKLNAR